MEHELTQYEALLLALDLAGSQTALAKICGVGQPAIWKMIHSSKRLGAEYVLKVEAATGVPRWQLRPDIYPRDLAPVPVLAVGEETPLCGPILSARQLAKNGNQRSILDGKGRAA